MFPVGGVSIMLLGAAISLAGCAVLAVRLNRYVGGPAALAAAGLVWWLTVIALVTLIPANGAPGIVSAEGRLASCSTDLGGPAPDGFWIFGSGQRLLNVTLFVPAGTCFVVAAARWRWAAAVAAPVGLVLLASYSLAVELVQLHVARLDRACDVTDIVDNTTGAALGLVLGGGLALLLRPWRRGAPVRR